jgi:LysR family transcriptional regulator (chromosome initiation inhibitor)
MSLLHPQLAVFMAVIEEGSFEAAARRLSVTPSAISQRMKALEDRLGQVLVLRQLPVKPSPAGKRLLRRVRPMQTLEAEAVAEFSAAPGPSRQTVAVAVNDDSLHTWVISALAELHTAHDYIFDVRVDDQDHTLELLRGGTVLGAVTGQSKPVQGCNVIPIGSMRYFPIASSDFVSKHFGQGFNAHSINEAPLIVFNRKDDLQWRLVRKVTRAKVSPAVHYLPTSLGFLDAAALGIGWCMAPESLVMPALKSRRVVVVDEKLWLDVPLYWQFAAVRSQTLENVTRGIRAAAARHLRGQK